MASPWLAACATRTGSGWPSSQDRQDRPPPPLAFVGVRAGAPARSRSLASNSAAALQVLDEVGQHRLRVVGGGQHLAQGAGGKLLLAQGRPVHEPATPPAALQQALVAQADQDRHDGGVATPLPLQGGEHIVDPGPVAAALAAAEFVTASRGGPVAHILASWRPFAYTLSGRSGGVVVSQGLLGLLDDDECDAMLAHELAHLHLRHHRLLGFTQVVSATVGRWCRRSTRRPRRLPGSWR